jgi:hypothetical protein
MKYVPVRIAVFMSFDEKNIIFDLEIQVIISGAENRIAKCCVISVMTLASSFIIIVDARCLVFRSGNGTNVHVVN